MRYSTFWKDLQTVAGLEKLAASDDALVAQQAQPILAGVCNDLFSSVKQAADDESALVGLMLSFRDDHRLTGEKLAAAPEETAELFQKLATAVYVDRVLTVSLEKQSGAEYDETKAVQLLGREYAVHLMRGLFA